MDVLERLTAIEEIKALRARFARCMDTKQWVEMQDTITDDCVFDCRAEGGVDELWIGAKDIVGNIRGSLATAVTVHHAHMPEIEIISPTSARESGQCMICCTFLGRQRSIWSATGIITRLTRSNRTESGG